LTSPGTPAPSTGEDAFLTRRELRAREAAAAESEGVERPGVPDGAGPFEVRAVAQAPVVPATLGVPSTPVNDSTLTSVTVPLRRLGAPSGATVAPAPVRRTSRLKKPLKAAVVLAAIPGMFLTAALPAYAFTPNGEVAAGASASRILSTTEAQAMTVAAGATLTVARDGFSATTKEELEERDRQAKRAAEVQRAADAARASSSASSGKYAVRGVRAEGDDYPWPSAATDNDGGGLSPLGYYYRECVDFVAWRLNRDAGSTGDPWTWKWGNLTPGGGSASSWKNQWDRHGWATSDTPVVGAVAWFTYNHVAYVQSIPGDGTVVLEEYNWLGSHAYHTRTVSIGSVAKYLYPPS